MKKIILILTSLLNLFFVFGFGSSLESKNSNPCFSNVGNKLIIENTLTDAQGSAVSMSETGATFAISGDFDNSGAGAVWVFDADSNGCSQQGVKLVGSGAVGSTSRQGGSIALSADGNTLAVVGAGDNSGIGAVWIFTRQGGVWSQENSKLVPSDTIGNSQFGTSIDLSADGNRLISSGPGDNNVGAT